MPNEGPSISGWNIFRAQPQGKIYGRAIPAFIDNYFYHLDTIDVYADGVISCRTVVDRLIFAMKIASGWVTTCPPVGKTISVFNLGSAEIAGTDWLIQPGDVQRLVDEAIQDLNPTMSNLVDMQGESSELRGNVRTAKFPYLQPNIFRREPNGLEVVGRELPVFMPGGQESQLTQWIIYSDSMSQFGCDGPLMSLSDAVRLVENGDVTTSVPDQSWITIEGLGRFRPEKGRWPIDPAERVREAYDELSILRGSPGSVRLCIAAHKAYQREPSDDGREALRSAYLAVPVHQRMYCGNMDSKDWPIRRILEDSES